MGARLSAHFRFLVILLTTQTCLFDRMSNYHPLDIRFKNKPDQNSKPNLCGTISTTAPKNKPWKIAKEITPTWQNAGPIRDDERSEHKNRENLRKEIENAELKNAPLHAILFSPAAIFYQFRAKYRSERATGRSKLNFALQLLGALALYFGLVYSDRIFGINEMLGAGI